MKMSLRRITLRARLVTAFVILLSLVVVGGTMPRALADSYDKARAVRYARTYAIRYNVQFPVFRDEDCTNFASQVLAAGGWTFRYSPNVNQEWWYGYDRGWWTNSRSWSLVHTLFNFIQNSNRGYLIGQGVKSNRGSYMSLEPGDLIFCDWYKNGTTEKGEDGWMDHVYIVTGKDLWNIYVSAHTTDRLDLRFSAVFDDPSISQGFGEKGRFYYMRMRTQY